ncbi:MAG: hypothetical protein QOJ61_2484 [Mycobacterium sp.]|jgi:hypothetical protein|nr:hypothetical protein [Mycobacterium sp.]
MRKLGDTAELWRRIRCTVAGVTRAAAAIRRIAPDQVAALAFGHPHAVAQG